MRAEDRSRVDVLQSDEADLVAIKARVEVAFNAAEETQASETPGISQENRAQVEWEAGEVRRQLEAEGRNTVFDFQLGEPRLSDVMVEDLGTYREVLRAVVHRIAEHFNISRTEESIDAEVEETIQHEHAHALPVLGQPDLDVFYRVSLFKRMVGDVMAYGYVPSVHLRGKVSAALLAEFLAGPDVASPGDQIHLRALESLDRPIWAGWRSLLGRLIKRS